ncbi:MAG: hypothetical protein ACFFDI_07425, partial [Promethearchaeota archaeon]
MNSLKIGFLVNIQTLGDNVTTQPIDQTLFIAIMLSFIIFALIGGSLLILRFINKLLSPGIRVYFTTVFGAVLIIILFLTGLFIVSNPIGIDPTEPFEYRLSNIRSPKDLSKAVALHQMVTTLNITDPLGFFFENVPQTSGTVSRTINLKPNTNSTNVHYLVNLSGTLKPTLLQIRSDYTRPEFQEDLKNYTLSFLNVPPTIENPIDIQVLFLPRTLGDTPAELMITFHDLNSEDVLILMFSSSRVTGFASTINEIYTTKDYS